MPRKGPARAIDDDWKARVRAGIDELEISDAEFARRAKISKAALSEIWLATTKQSTLVAVIHKALGWPAPRALLMSQDDEEIFKILQRLDPRDKAALKERALTLEEARKRR